MTLGKDTVPLGPFRGLNNTDDPRGSPFQLPKRKGEPQPALRVAQNVDLDRLGWVKRRTGRTKRLALSDAHSLASVAERLLLVEAGEILEVDSNSWTTQLRVSGVDSNAEMSFLFAGTEIFWSNGLECGSVDGAPWGLAPCSQPQITVRTGGSLRAGRYLVAVTGETDTGLESGSLAPVAVEVVQEGAALELSGFSWDAAVSSLNVYVSDTDGRQPFFVASVPATQPITVHQVALTTDPLDTFGLYPPPPAQHLELYRGRILVAKDNVLYWSQPLGFHHFSLATDIQLFTAPIRMLAALDTGFYIATAYQTYWVEGDEPAAWQPRLVDSKLVAEGRALRVLGRKFPALQYDGPVVIWVTADGPVAGLPDGRVVPLTENQVAMDANNKATVAYRESEGLRQILLSLKDRGASSHFAGSDRVSCTVIKAVI